MPRTTDPCVLSLPADPFLWVDRRGNFHLLSHTWSDLPYPSNAISAHGEGATRALSRATLNPVPAAIFSCR